MRIKKSKIWTKNEVKKETLEAEQRIRQYIRETPLEYSPYLSQVGKGDVFLKLENIQLTGSFKLRGATNKILSLSPEEIKRGIVTASSGNHGSAIAYLLNKFGLKGRIYLPEYITKPKIELLSLYGTLLEIFGTDCIETENHAREEAQRLGATYVPPYNDPKIIGGQGTVAIELFIQLKKFDIVIVPVGGGGLISGIAGYIKALDPRIKIIGCQPENSAVMYESVKAGHIVKIESKPTLSDGTAGGIEQESLTFNICKDYVDNFILVSEEEIKEAIQLNLEKHNMLVEGAGALSTAAYLKEKDQFKNKTAVLIISGSKISLNRIKSILCKGELIND